MYEPKVGLLPSETDENSWTYKNGKWEKVKAFDTKTNHPKEYINKFAKFLKSTKNFQFETSPKNTNWMKTVLFIIIKTNLQPSLDHLIILETGTNNNLITIERLL